MKTMYDVLRFENYLSEAYNCILYFIQYYVFLFVIEQVI